MTEKTWREKMEEKPTAELDRIRDNLAMLYDDNYRSVYDAENERYDEKDLESWDRQIGELDEILWRRQGVPIVHFAENAESLCQRHQDRDPLSDDIEKVNCHHCLNAYYTAKEARIRENCTHDWHEDEGGWYCPKCGMWTEEK